MRLLERALQLVQLVRGEGRAVPSVLLFGVLLLRQLRVAGGGRSSRQPGARPSLPGLLGAVGAGGWDEETPTVRDACSGYPGATLPTYMGSELAQGGGAEGCEGSLSFSREQVGSPCCAHSPQPRSQML